MSMKAPEGRLSLCLAWRFSLAREGAESSFDFEKQLFSAASREMSFGRSFFQGVTGAMEAAARHPGEPAGDGFGIRRGRS
jgi:hypothetical protein